MPTHTTVIQRKTRRGVEVKRRSLTLAFIASLACVAGCILGPKQDDPAPVGAGDPDGGFTSDATGSSDTAEIPHVDSSAASDTAISPPPKDAGIDAPGADSSSGDAPSPDSLVDGSSDSSPVDARDAGAGDAGDALSDVDAVSVDVLDAREDG